MDEDNYKLKYIKYKKKYTELKKIHDNMNIIINKIVILPNEYELLNQDNKDKFVIYELDNTSKPISYIRKEYKNKLEKNINNQINDQMNMKEEYILEKKIITPDEYYLLSDKNKTKYEIYESDYNKFPNRVVPKNYIKII